MFSKDATLATTKLSKTDHPDTIYRAPSVGQAFQPDTDLTSQARKPDLQVCQWTEADKAAHPSVEKMPYQPLATRGGLPTDEQAAPSVGTHNISAPRGRVKLRAR